MQSYSRQGRARAVALCAASTLALMLMASPVTAQDYGRYSDQSASYRSGSEEQVEVTGHRFNPHRNSIGAEIRNVSASRAVRFGDLDLRTNRGARELRARIRYTADTLCRKLDAFYPIAADDSPPCYKLAINDAMSQADQAIRQARGDRDTE